MWSAGVGQLPGAPHFPGTQVSEKPRSFLSLACKSSSWHWVHRSTQEVEPKGCLHSQLNRRDSGGEQGSRCVSIT